MTFRTACDHFFHLRFHLPWFSSINSWSHSRPWHRVNQFFLSAPSPDINSERHYFADQSAYEALTTWISWEQRGTKGKSVGAHMPLGQCSLRRRSTCDVSTLGCHWERPEEPRQCLTPAVTFLFPFFSPLHGAWQALQVPSSKFSRRWHDSPTPCLGSLDRVVSIKSMN